MGTLGESKQTKSKKPRYTKGQAHRQQELSQKGKICICVHAKHHWLTHSLALQLSQHSFETRTQIPRKTLVLPLPLN